MLKFRRKKITDKIRVWKKGLWEILRSNASFSAAWAQELKKSHHLVLWSQVQFLWFWLTWCIIQMSITNSINCTLMPNSIFIWEKFTQISEFYRQKSTKNWPEKFEFQVFLNTKRSFASVCCTAEQFSRKIEQKSQLIVIIWHKRHLTNFFAISMLNSSEILCVVLSCL